MVELYDWVLTVLVHTGVSIVEELVELEGSLTLNTVQSWYKLFHFADHPYFNRFKVLHSEYNLSCTVSFEVTILVVGACTCDVLRLNI